MHDDWMFSQYLATISNNRSRHSISVLNAVGKIGSKNWLEWRCLDSETGKPGRGVYFNQDVARNLRDALTEYLD